MYAHTEVYRPHRITGMPLLFSKSFLFKYLATIVIDVVASTEPQNFLVTLLRHIFEFHDASAWAVLVFIAGRNQK